DIAKDGTEVAWTTTDKRAFFVSLKVPSSQPIAIEGGAQRLSYHGATNVLVDGADDTSTIAQSARQRTVGTHVVTPLGTNVKIKTIKASPDDLHLYHEEVVGTTSE